MHHTGSEFDIIKRYFESGAKAQKSPNQNIVLGIGDDCAIIEPSPNIHQVISVDTSIAGRHFPEDAPANVVASRALSVAVSDLAAMGATPSFFTLSISLPHANPDWLEAFSQGLFETAERYEIALVGGDTTKGELSITIQVHGEVEPDKAWLRSGAKVGDYIYVTGQLGNAAGGLLKYQEGEDAEKGLVASYLNPLARLDLVPLLRDKVSACIDISDGFLADLKHILNASIDEDGHCPGAIIDLEGMPLSDELTESFGEAEAMKMALTGGDDYQLCFTSSNSPLDFIGPEFGDITCIGAVTDMGRLELINPPQGLEQWLKKGLEIDNAGYDHFKA